MIMSTSEVLIHFICSFGTSMHCEYVFNNIVVLIMNMWEIGSFLFSMNCDIVLWEILQEKQMVSKMSNFCKKFCIILYLLCP